MPIFKIEIESNDAEGFKLDLVNKASWNATELNLKVKEGTFTELQISKRSLFVAILKSSMKKRAGSFKISTRVETSESELVFDLAGSGGATNELKISTDIDNVVLSGVTSVRPNSVRVS
jgi:hypothetical protein